MLYFNIQSTEKYSIAMCYFGAGTDVVEVHGVAGADGQVVGASVGKEVEVCPGLVWSVLGRALENLV